MASGLQRRSVATLLRLRRTVCQWKVLVHATILIPFGILAAAPALICAQVDGIVCTDGEGAFTSNFDTGVTVTVRASETHGIANRSCEAALSYGKKTVQVVTDAWQVDVDVMGVNFIRGKPIVAIQYKQHDVDPQMTYAIYSLQKPPRLLRAITGGDFFRAADFGFDGHIEIRTGDVTEANGFDGLPLSSFDFAPAVFLRLEENDKLIDVSSEFQKEYDRSIADLQTSLNPTALAAFKATDGRLDSMFLLPADQMHSLITTKIKILEIVWCYLYSGRQAQAWNTLSQLWPAADVERVRAAIVKAQQLGIRNQIDDISTRVQRPKIKHIFFYSTSVDLHKTQMEGTWTINVDPRAWSVDINPKAIYLRTGCLSDSCAFQHDVDIVLNLSVDDAGKVVSAKLVDTTLKGPAVDLLLKSAMYWKFIPAYKSGMPVACSMQQDVSPYR